MTNEPVCPACGVLLESTSMDSELVACPACDFLGRSSTAKSVQSSATISPEGDSDNSSGERIVQADVAPQSPSHAEVARRPTWTLWLLLLAFIPLAFSVYGTPSDVDARIQATLEKNPQVVTQLGKLHNPTLEDVLERLPERALIGAHVAADSWIQFIYAAICIAAYILLALLVFRVGYVQARLLMPPIFLTGIVGVLLLCGILSLSEWSTRNTMAGGHPIFFPAFLLARAIAYSHRVALDPANSFVSAFLGFTFGVGLLEELVKALPLLLRKMDHPKDTWYPLCLCGFASGIGFGAAEGVIYAFNYYNGVEPKDVYAIRFISCAALHAVWTAIVGINLSRTTRRDFDYTLIGGILKLLGIYGVPMTLHGLYNVLLQHDHQPAALSVAILSCCWLIGIIGVERRREKQAIAVTDRALATEEASGV